VIDAAGDAGDDVGDAGPARHPIVPRRSPVSTAEVPRHWFGGDPVATHIANGVNMLFPAGERFFVRSVNHYLDRIDDPGLRAQVRGFFGQEGRHAKAHDDYNERLRQQGYQIDGFLAMYEKVARGVLERTAPPALRLAATAAAEHFTAIMAENALSRNVLEQADPTMRELLTWHAAEEIEHKAVAFDVLRAVNPSYALRMAGLTYATVSLVSFWILGTTTLLRQDGLTRRDVRRRMREMRGENPIVRNVFLRGIREYMRRDFHPDDNDNYHLARARLERMAAAGAA
jgi:uncharacterized protein